MKVTLNWQMWWLMTTAYFLIIAADATAQPGADQAEWQLKRDQDGIRVYTRPVPGSRYKAIRATVTVQAQLMELVALMMDVDACPRWVDRCKRAEVLEVRSETELFLYTINNAPWPVANRDSVSRIFWTQDPQTHVITMTATAIDGMVPRRAKTVRLRQAEFVWEFRPLSDGRIVVTNEAHVDPAGPVPAWLVNMLLVESPFKTMQRLRRLLRNGDFVKREFDFVVEPSGPALTPNADKGV